MATDVDIANMALTHIGSRMNIESLTEQSKEADHINLWFDTARKSTLEAYDWSCARKRQALSEHSQAAPEGEWQYRYQYPSDCLRARSIANATIVNQSIVRGVPIQLVQPDAIPFEIETIGEEKTILTDMEDAVLIYTFDQTAYEIYPAMLVRAFSYDLASMVAIGLTGKVALKEKMEQTWWQYINLAAATNANERVERAERDSAWIRGRS